MKRNVMCRETEKINTRMPCLRRGDVDPQPGLKPDALSGDSKPALLYVSAVCKVLSLHSTLDEEVSTFSTTVYALYIFYIKCAIYDSSGLSKQGIVSYELRIYYISDNPSY